MRTMKSLTAALVVASAVVAPSVWAQGAAGDTNPDPGGGSAGGEANKAVSPGDRAFLERAIQNANANRSFGQLAQNVGSKDQVRSLGSAMVDDATSQLTDLRNFAQKTNAVIPNGMSPTQQQEFERLGRLKGSRFDQAFLSYAGAQARSQLGEMVQQAATGQNPELRTLASNEADALRTRLERATAAGATAPQGTGQEPRPEPKQGP